MSKSMLRVDDGVYLENVVYEPRYDRPFCTIVLSSGICMSYQDYADFLKPLFGMIKVVGYNYRGHGLSRGAFNPTLASSDLKKIVVGESSPIFLMGHSFGAGVSAGLDYKVSGRIFLCPYLDRDDLAGFRRFTLDSARRFRAPLRFIDRLFTSSGIAGYMGFKSRHPLVDLSLIDKMSAPRGIGKNEPALWMIPDRDEVLGTWRNPSHSANIRARLQVLYPKGSDGSNVVAGLNHMLNSRVGDLFGTFKCPIDQRRSIINTILDFCQTYSFAAIS